MKKIILILVMLLAILIPTLALTSVSADVSFDDFENNFNNLDNDLLIERDLIQVLIDDFDVKRNYSNLYFKYNNFGSWASDIDYDECKFWGKIIDYYNNNNDNALIGCEIKFTIYEPITDYNYTYMTGFTYNDARGTYSQYVGDDTCVLLGSQLLDLKTGLKTYTIAKPIEYVSFNIVAFEIYVRTQEVDLNYPNNIEYYYVNANHPLEEKAEKFLRSIHNAVYPRVVISAPYNTLIDTYNEGKNVGIQEGFDNGYNVGQEEGYNEGYSKGNSDGYNEGYSNGYDVGYADNGAVANLPDIIPDTINTIWNTTFKPILDFEIFGLQVKDLVFLIASMAFALLLIKFIKVVV